MFIYTEQSEVFWRALSEHSNMVQTSLSYTHMFAGTLISIPDYQSETLSNVPYCISGTLLSILPYSSGHLVCVPGCYMVYMHVVHDSDVGYMHVLWNNSRDTLEHPTGHVRASSHCSWMIYGTPTSLPIIMYGLHTGAPAKQMGCCPVSLMANQ